jgi:hypothetical protein
MAPIFTYAAHNKIHTTDKLHIIVHNFAPERETDPEFRIDENTKNKDAVQVRILGSDFGAGIESQCGLKGIFLQNDLRGIESFRERYGKIDTVYFFMPVPSLDIEKLDTNKFKTLDEVPDEYRIQITDERVCDRCRDNFEANLRHKDRSELGPGGFGPKLLDK